MSTEEIIPETYLNSCLTPNPMKLSEFSESFGDGLEHGDLRVSWVTFQPADMVQKTKRNADRISVTLSENGWIVILVIDGHGGQDCAELAHTLLRERVPAYLNKCEPPSTQAHLEPISDGLSNLIKDVDDEILSALDRILRELPTNDNGEVSLDPRILDNESMHALRCAVSGAVLSLVVLPPKSPFGLVLNVGDCHVVLYTPKDTKPSSWQIQNLGHHHDTSNSAELQRLRLIHGSEDSLISEGRLLGLTEFTRAVGNAFWKLPLTPQVRRALGDLLHDVGRPGLFPKAAALIGERDVSGKYILAAAESRTFSLEPGCRLIVASDGLPSLSGMMSPLQNEGRAQEVYGSWCEWMYEVPDGLPAARLLYQHYGGTEGDFAHVLRTFGTHGSMDDISIAVVEVLQ